MSIPENQQLPFGLSREQINYILNSYMPMPMPMSMPIPIINDNMESDNITTARDSENEITLENLTLTTISTSPEYVRKASKQDFIIISVLPVNPLNANFNNIAYPDEEYYVKTDKYGIYIYNAHDLNEYTLETYKTVYEYNKTLEISHLEQLQQLEHLQQLVHLQQPEQQPEQQLEHQLEHQLAFIYCRSSRVNDCSIATQKTENIKYANKHGLQLLPFGFQYDNNVSARNMKNLNDELGFWTVDNMFIPDGAHIIMYSVDRLSRNLQLGIQWLNSMVKRNIQIHFVSQDVIYKNNISSTVKSIVHQALLNAEQFSDITSEKIKNTIKRKAELGNYHGTAPYGFVKHKDNNGIHTLVANNKEQFIINQIKARYTSLYKYNFPTLTYKKKQIYMIKTIIKYCNDKGFKNKNGNSFTPHHIKSIISNI